MNKRYGGLVEWPMAPAWKVGEAQASEGSNPLSSAKYTSNHGINTMVFLLLKRVPMKGTLLTIRNLINSLNNNM